MGIDGDGRHFIDGSALGNLDEDAVATIGLQIYLTVRVCTVNAPIVSVVVGMIWPPAVVVVVDTIDRGDCSERARLGVTRFQFQLPVKRLAIRRIGAPHSTFLPSQRESRSKMPRNLSTYIPLCG